MEVFAGFVEHTDARVGKLLDGLDQLGIHNDAIVFYVATTARAPEGRSGRRRRAAGAARSPSASTSDDRGVGQARRLRCARRTKVDNVCSRRLGIGGRHAAPLHQFNCAHFGGTRNPDGCALAGAHQARQTPRSPFPPRQRHRADHLRDPRHQAAEGRRRLPAGSHRHPRDMVYTFADATAPGPKAHAVLRQQRQPWRSITTAGSPAPLVR